MTRSALFRLRFEEGRARRVETIPIWMPRGRVQVADGERAAEILEKLRVQSRKMGTPLELEAGRAFVDIDSDPLPAAAVPTAESPLRALYTGRVAPGGPAKARAWFGARDAIAVIAWWEPWTREAVATFRWVPPDGGAAMDEVLALEEGWTRTRARHSGPLPMQAGQWRVRVSVDGREVGVIEVSVRGQKNAR